MTNDAARVALVTGGARGIGAAIAARLARDGSRVIVADRDAAGSAPPGGRYAVCDVGDETAVTTLLSGVAAGEGRLDALICNAGIMIRKPIAQLALDEWSRVIGTNLTSTFLLVRAAEALLRAAKGAVVTIASTRAHMSEPDTEAYAASKGGLVALTHALAISLGTGCAGELHQPGMDLHQGRPATPGGPRVPSRRPRRNAGRHRGLGGVAGGTGERFRHWRGIRRRWWRDAQDDLSGLIPCRSFLRVAALS